MPHEHDCSALSELKDPLMGTVAIRHGSHLGILKDDGRFTCLEAADIACPLGTSEEVDLCFRYHGDPLVACCDETRVHLHVHLKDDCDEKDQSKSFKLLESDLQCDVLPVSDSLPTGCVEFPSALTRHQKCLAGCIGDQLKKPVQKVFHGDHYDHLVPNAKDGTLELHHIHSGDDGTEHCDFHGQIYLSNNQNNCGLRHAEDVLPQNALSLHRYEEPCCMQKWPHSFALFSLEPCVSTGLTSKVDQLLGRNSFTTPDVPPLIQTVQRTVLIVEGICCPSEEPIIRKILEPMKGVESVQINVMAKKVIVMHDNFLAPQVNLVSALNGARLGARIFHDSNGAQLKSRYPPITVAVSGICFLLSLLSQLEESVSEPHKAHLKYFKYLGIVACVIGYPPIGLKAYGSLKSKVMDVNCLMSIAIIGALIIGEFVEAGAVVFLFSLGEWLEKRVTERTRLALTAITSMRPDEAETQKGERIPVEAVNVGDVLVIRVGTKAPVDGIILRGEAQFDESQITGESLPVQKAIGGTVHAGTISVSGYVEMEATCRAEDSSVAKLSRLVEEAASSRSPMEKSVETFSKYYTPLMITLAFLLATIPWFFTISPLGEEPQFEWEQAMAYTKNALILLVMACPCALVISTPVTYISALVTCTHNSIMVKGGKFLEVLSAVKIMMFDKTGTLTESCFKVQEFTHLSSTYSEETVLRSLRAVEECANHPLANCIVRYADDQIGEEAEEVKVNDFEVVDGEGVQGKVDGKLLNAGNVRLAERMNWPLDVHGISGTLIWVGINGEFVASLVLDDTIRDGVAGAIDKLHQLNVRTVMLTGDNDKQAQSVGKSVGIQEIESELLPQDKIARVHDRKRPDRQCKIAMVGDGINDAAALAAADVGVAMGAAGTALAVETADITLLDSNLSRLPFLIEIGRSAVRVIHFNIGFSVVTKAILLVLTFMQRTTLWHAILADIGTMLLVTLNGMRLMRLKGARVMYVCHDEKKNIIAAKRRRRLGCCSGGHSHSEGSCCDVAKTKPSCADKKCCKKEEVKPSSAEKKCCKKEEVKPSCTEKKCCAKDEMRPGCADKKCCAKEEVKPSYAEKKCCKKEEVKSSCAEKKCCAKEDVKPSCAEKKCCSKEEVKLSCVDQKCCAKEEVKASCADKRCCKREEVKPSCAEKKCCKKEEVKASCADKGFCKREEVKPSCADKKCCKKEQVKPSCAEKKCCAKEEVKSSCADKKCGKEEEVILSCAEKKCCKKIASPGDSLSDTLETRGSSEAPSVQI